MWTKFSANVCCCVIKSNNAFKVIWQEAQLTCGSQINLFRCCRIKTNIADTFIKSTFKATKSSNKTSTIILKDYFATVIITKLNKLER